MLFETFPSAPEKKEPHLEEFAFTQAVLGHVLGAFEESLEDVGFEPEQVEEFKKSLRTLDEEGIRGVLSLPYELREGRLSRLKKRIDEGELTVGEVVELLHKEASLKGYTIAFHVSDYDIPKNEAHGAWVVDGKEQDHRDADLPRAYYSLDFEHLYTGKKAGFIYLVRAQTGEGTSHRQDNDEKWGRATKLDIIDRLHYDQLMEETEKIVEKLKQPTSSGDSSEQ